MNNFFEIKTAAVIGAGNWGTTLANLIAGNGIPVKLLVRDQLQLQTMRQKRINEKYLPGIRLNDLISFCGNPDNAAENADAVFLVVPSHTLRSVFRSLSGTIKSGTVIVSAIKGIETDSLKRMSGVIAEELPGNPVTILSGPNIAAEIAAGLPAASLAASRQPEAAAAVQACLMSRNFRVYTAADTAGVEFGGALKNIMAIGAGIIDELQLGDNCRATFMTRGLAEITRLGCALGAEPATFAGLSGLGDIIVTCTSHRSRNFRAGRLLAQGRTLEEINAELQMVAEGIKTTLAAHKLATLHNIEMPITAAAYQIIYEHQNPEQILRQLMTRGKKAENV